MLRFLKWVAGLLLVLLLLAVGLLGYVTATDSGLQRLLSLGQQYAPGVLTWGQAEGKLTGPLDLAGLAYRQDNGLSVRVDQAALRWRPSALFSHKLAIQRLALSGVVIHLPKGEAPDEEASSKPLELPDIHLPLDVAVDELDLKDIRIYSWGAKKPLVIERIRLSALGEGESLQLVALDIRAPEGEAHLSGMVRPIGNYPLNLQLDWRYRHPEFGQFSGKGSAHGDLHKLKLTQSLNGAVDAELNGEVTTVLSHPGWDAMISLNAASLGVFSPELQGSPLQATIRSRGTIDQFRASGQIATSIKQTGPFTLDFSAEGGMKAITLKSAQLKLRDHPGDLTLAGVIQLQPLQLNLRGDWQKLGWPLRSAERAYRSPMGAVTFAGTPQDFVATVDTTLEGAQLGQLQLTLDATGEGDRVTLRALDLKSSTDPLHLKASGAFDLKQRTLSAKGHWTSLHWPLAATSGALVASPDGGFTLDGQLDAYQFALNAEAMGQNIPHGYWNLTGAGSDQALTRFDLSGKLLDGTLAAGGTASWKPEIRWDVRLRGAGLNPGVKWPDVPGKINLQVNSQGRFVKGRADLTAAIQALNGTLRGQRLKGTGEVALNGERVKVNRLKLSSGSASLKADGELGAQWNMQWRLAAPDLSALAPRLKGDIKGHGMLQGSAQQPRLTLDLDARQLIAGTTRIGRIQGKADIDISGAHRSTINFVGKGLVLAGQKWSNLALTGGGVPARHRLKFSLEGAAARLNLGLSGGLKNQKWHGRLTELSALKTAVGDWRLERPAGLTLDPNSAVAERFCLTSKPSSICVDGRWKQRTGAKGKVEISALDSDRFSEFLPADMVLQTRLDGVLEGRLDAQNRADGTATLTLEKGTLKVTGDSGPIVMPFGESRVESVYRGNSLASELTLDLGALGGLDGDIRLKSLDTKPLLGGTIKAEIGNLSIISAFVPQLQAVQGQLRADLKLAGPLTMPAVNGVLQLKSFAAEVPQMSIHIKDTRFSARSDGRGPLIITGQAKSGAGLLKLSGEVDPATRRLGLQIKGKRFQVANTRNIRAEISPDMKVEMDSKGMRVNGELVIPHAFIKAGGSGEAGLASVSPDVVIVEDGKPAEKAKTGNFYLNLRVVLGDDIKVEVADFKGALKGNLVVEQEPELAPRGTGVIEVVNGDYVVYGQQLKIQRGRILFGGGPIDNPRLDLDVARKVEAYDVLAGARIRGTAQAPLLQLYSEPSMPDASILSYMLLGQPPGTKGGSYTLGKYLTPDLYVGYGIGLFNAINTFNMRYKLTDKLALQAASGVASSADLIYTIER